MAGGVVFHANANFVLESTAGPHPISPNGIEITIRDQSIFLVYEKQAFLLDTFLELGCRLGRFIDRDGLIAYSIPPDASDTTMILRGLVQKNQGDGSYWIAKEFVNSDFEALLEKADFADVEPVKDLKNGVSLAKRAMDNINSAIRTHTPEVGLFSYLFPISYINTDFQVTYNVYLNTSILEVDVEGVPFRYNWRPADNRSAIISSVYVYSQNWPSNQKLSSIEGIRSNPTQYDVVSFFQVAGIFRALKLNDSRRFSNSVETMCRMSM